MKPVYKWVGGKRKLVPELNGHFERWRRNHPYRPIDYVEPFLGGGAFALHRMSVGVSAS